jgi:hypothetical protein
MPAISRHVDNLKAILQMGPALAAPQRRWRGPRGKIPGVILTSRETLLCVVRTNAHSYGYDGRTLGSGGDGPTTASAACPICSVGAEGMPRVRLR